MSTSVHNLHRHCAPQRCANSPGGVNSRLRERLDADPLARLGNARHGEIIAAGTLGVFARELNAVGRSGCWGSEWALVAAGPAVVFVQSHVCGQERGEGGTHLKC